MTVVAVVVVLTGGNNLRFRLSVCSPARLSVFSFVLVFRPYIHVSSLFRDDAAPRGAVPSPNIMNNSFKAVWFASA